MRLRQLGKRLGINKVHPHKFRRTLCDNGNRQRNANRTASQPWDIEE